MLNAGSRIVNNWIYPIDNGYVLIDTGYEWRFFAPFPVKWTQLRLSAAHLLSCQSLMHQDQLCQSVTPFQPRKAHLTSAQNALQRVNLQ